MLVQITVVLRAGRDLDSFLERDKPDGVEIRVLTRLLHRDFGQDTMSFAVVFSTGIFPAGRWKSQDIPCAVNKLIYETRPASGNFAP